MKQDEIIEMARQSGFGNYTFEALSMFVAFAKLVAAKAAAKEREACAKVCETDGIGAKYQGDVYAQAIRARGEQA